MPLAYAPIALVVLLAGSALAQDLRWKTEPDPRWRVEPDLRFSAPVVEEPEEMPVLVPVPAPPVPPPLFSPETVAPGTSPLMIEFFNDPTPEKGRAYLKWKAQRDQAREQGIKLLQQLAIEEQKGK